MRVLPLRVKGCCSGRGIRNHLIQHLKDLPNENSRSPAILRHNWQVKTVESRCAKWRCDVCVHCKMITPIKPINTCTPSHQPASLSVVGGLTKYIDSDGASQAYSTVLLIMVTTLHVRDPGPRLMTARRYPLATKAFSLVSQLDQNRIRSRLNVLFIPL